MNKISATLLFLSLAACGDSADACPPGEVRIGAACVPMMPDAGPDVRVDEVCNGVDDDMDGTVDEADPMLGQACGEAVGICTVGATVCTDGSLVCDGVQASDEESCNGLDDDCDGEVDEDATQDFFLDVDGDGYGSGDACNACAAEECGEGDWVTMDGDCDETCDTCYLGATEVCDELDNNCDTFVDEGVQVLLYTDSDADGFGAGLGMPGCVDEEGNAPAGFATEDGDCGPDDDRAFPGTTRGYATPIMGADAGLPFDFNCDASEEFKSPRCNNVEGDAVPTCTALFGSNICWLGDDTTTCGEVTFIQPTFNLLRVGMTNLCTFNGDLEAGALECL